MCTVPWYYRSSSYSVSCQNVSRPKGHGTIPDRVREHIQCTWLIHQQKICFQVYKISQIGAMLRSFLRLALLARCVINKDPTVWLVGAIPLKE
jgi:hypothetical protein